MPLRARYSLSSILFFSRRLPSGEVYETSNVPCDLPPMRTETFFLHPTMGTSSYV